MPFNNRKTMRKRLGTLLTNSGAYQAVYDYPEKNIRQQSPVCLLFSDGAMREIATDDYETSDFYITVVHMVKRDNESAAQDALDDLELNLIQVIKANYNDANWTLAEYDQRSTVLGDTSEQVPYLIETFLIRILDI